MWRDQQSGQVVTRHDQIRALRPNVSFPAAMTDEMITSHGFVVVGEGSRPSVTEHQSAVRGDPVQDASGNWASSWTVRDWSAEEIAAYEKAKVPQSVTARQGMAELIDRDLVAAVQAVLDAIPGKEGALARNDFTKSQEWERRWPLIAQLQPALGWSDAFVDEMFISAKAR